MTQELDTQAGKQYSLDKTIMLWQEAQLRSQRVKEDTKWLDEYKDTIKAVAGEADEFTINGEVVARLVPGQLNVSKLAAEQPQLHQRYMRLVSKHQFDSGSLERDEPEIFEKYRARRFCVIGE